MTSNICMTFLGNQTQHLQHMFNSSFRLCKAHHTSLEHVHAPIKNGHLVYSAKHFACSMVLGRYKRAQKTVRILALAPWRRCINTKPKINKAGIKHSLVKFVPSCKEADFFFFFFHVLHFWCVFPHTSDHFHTHEYFLTDELNELR